MDTRSHIVQTALQLFLQKSFKEVTMQELVKASGLSKGAFYHYFQNKEALFREIAQMFFTLGKIPYHTFRTDTLRNFYLDYVSTIARSFQELEQLTGPDSGENQSMNFFYILFESIRKFPELLEVERNEYQRSLNAWTLTIQQARINGEIKSNSDDKTVAELFLYLTDGVFLRAVNNANQRGYAELLQEAFETLYSTIRSS